MLGPKDLKGLANLIDPENKSEFQNQASEIDINHLDYRYVQECKDRRELQQLLDYLRTGREGYYPDLEMAIMKRMEDINPSIRVRPISDQERYQEKQLVDKELGDWLEKVSDLPPKLERLGVERSLDIEPKEDKPIFISSSSRKEQKPSGPKKTSNRLKSTDYRAWDKLDVDKELELIEKGEETVKSNKTQIVTSEPEVKVPADLSTEERILYALNEKTKGNECLKVEEYDQAYVHYTTSIKLNPTAAVYNNRALVNIKVKMNSRAVDDCTEALKLEKSFKSYLRRALANFYLGKYQDALSDVDCALEIESKSKEALDLRKKIADKWIDVEGNTAKKATGKKNKIKIDIVEEEVEKELFKVPERDIRYDVEDQNGPKIVEIEEVQTGVNFVDVDEDSEDEDDRKVVYASDDSDD